MIQKVWLILACTTSLCAAADLQQITTDGTNKRDPRFVDGGNAVIYCYDETPDLIRMMKIEIGDKQAETVFEDSGNKHHIEPRHSPDHA